MNQATTPAVHGASSETPVSLVYLPIAPSGASDLGPLQAHCVRVESESVPGQQRVGLAQLDCSAPLLRRALEEQALMLGANALVDAVCSEHPASARIDCEARAFQLSSRTRPTLGPTDALARTDLPAAYTVFGTYVQFLPGRERGRARSSSQDPVSHAQEVPRQPVADRSIGTLQVVVIVPTSRDEAIQCIRLAAKHFHAAHFGSPSCIEAAHSGGWSCRSELFAPELDERAIAKLR